MRLQIRAEFFNAFNRTRFVPFATNSTGSFTAINAAATQVVSSTDRWFGFRAILMGNRDMGRTPNGQLVGGLRSECAVNQLR